MMVDLEKCVGHGKCAEVCPVTAITIGNGASARRVEVLPEVGTDFQTNVRGIYLVGELGGRGLIRNAVNEGRTAMENIVADLRRNPPRDGDVEVHDVAIVGSGPAGLSAGLEALRAGLPVVLEQGTVADTVRKYPRHKILMAEPVRILYGDLWIGDATKETLLAVWETTIRNSGLRIESGCQVTGIERQGLFFHLNAGACGRCAPAASC
ncbi:MAG: NAD(P)-binding domain-containing protein [Candidatus Eisenbacteria bacterium]